MYGGTKYVTYNTRKYGKKLIFKQKCFAASLRFQLQGITSAAATAAILDIAEAAATTTAAILTPVPNFTGSRGPWVAPGLKPTALRPCTKRHGGTHTPPPIPIFTVAHV
jgi:hypothetical protein